MPARNSTHFISMRDQVINIFKELQEILNKFLTLLIALIAATNTDSGKYLFIEQHKLMMPLLLTIVLYFFFAIIGTILQIYNGNLLPIIICALLIEGGAVSFLAFSFISITVAWITLATWVGMFIFVAYDYGIPQRIKNSIKGRIAWSQVAASLEKAPIMPKSVVFTYSASVSVLLCLVAVMLVLIFN